MGKIKMNLQQFADRHGLQVKNYDVRGPLGQIYQAGDLNFYYFTPHSGTHKFSPKVDAELAIEAIGLQYTPPPKKDRRAFLIVKKAAGGYAADKAGPFKTREVARMARQALKNNQQKTPDKTS